MPLYEYECEVCHHRFEVIQKFSDPPVEQCTACGGHVRKLLSSPAIQFKGSGWYITDYARKGSEGSKSSGEKSDSGSSTASSGSAGSEGSTGSGGSTGGSAGSTGSTGSKSSS
jgi:putative FmdB family regulatory protein